MLNPEFSELQRALVRAGVAPRYVCRTIQELTDHLDDIAADAIAAGADPAAARAAARAVLGTDQDLLAAVAARTELQSWAARWPRAAAIVNQSAFWLAMPFVPVIYCAQHRAAIARWGVSAGLGAVVTAGLLFSMQLAVV